MKRVAFGCPFYFFEIGSEIEGKFCQHSETGQAISRTMSEERTVSLIKIKKIWKSKKSGLTKVC